MVNTIMAVQVRSGALNPERWEQIRAILYRVLELPAGERAAWLDESCGADASLRAEVESLAEASDERASFLDTLALDLDTLALDLDTVALEAEPLTSGLAPGQFSPGQTIGHYSVVEKLGEGGMGAVYKAIDRRLDRIAAVKVISRFDGTGLEKRRFILEAKAASALNHPNIVTIYEYNSENGMDYMAMEYIQGTTLDRVMADQHGVGRETVPLETLIGYACQVAGALAKAHEAGIAHRDLKPANIMVTTEGIVKVLDFGLAKQVTPHGVPGESVTSLSWGAGPMGTPAYMSPEQAKGELTNFRSDIFSFGIILYEMTCRLHPFKGPDRLATLNNIVRQEPPSVAAANPAVPAALAEVIERCLRKEQAERPHMAEIRADLVAVVDSLTRRPGQGVVRKRRVPWMVAAGVALAAVAGVGAWYSGGHGNSAPERALTYTLQAQKPGGEPYVASTGDTFHGGEKFRLVVESRQAGFLYVINEGPGANGAGRFWILYPPETGSGQLEANHALQTGWYVFDRNPGTERLWLVWSDRAVPAFQEAVGGGGGGEVKGEAEAGRVREFVSGLGWRSKTIRTAKANGVQLRGAEGVLGDLVELRHR